MTRNVRRLAAATLLAGALLAGAPPAPARASDAAGPCEGPFIVLAIQRTKPGRGAEFVRLNERVVASMLREAAGLVSLDLNRGATRAEDVLLFEHWRDEAAWRAYHADRPPDARAPFERYDALWVAPVDSRTWCTVARGAGQGEAGQGEGRRGEAGRGEAGREGAAVPGDGARPGE